MQYLYDVLNNRIGQIVTQGSTVTSEYYINDGLDLLAVLDGGWPPNW